MNFERIWEGSSNRPIVLSHPSTFDLLYVSVVCHFGHLACTLVNRNRIDHRRADFTGFGMDLGGFFMGNWGMEAVSLSTCGLTRHFHFRMRPVLPPSH